MQENALENVCGMEITLSRPQWVNMTAVPEDLGYFYKIYLYLKNRGEQM